MATVEIEGTLPKGLTTSLKTDSTTLLRIYRTVYLQPLDTDQFWLHWYVTTHFPQQLKVTVLIVVRRVTGHYGKRSNLTATSLLALQRLYSLHMHPMLMANTQAESRAILLACWLTSLLPAFALPTPQFELSTCSDLTQTLLLKEEHSHFVRSSFLPAGHSKMAGDHKCSCHYTHNSYPGSGKGVRVVKMTK